MKEIYVKELPESCEGCQFCYFNGAEHDDARCWIDSNLRLGNEDMIDAHRTDCPLRSLEAHDKAVRAEVAREIIMRLKNASATMLKCGEKLSSDTMIYLADELSEQYEVTK